MTDETEDPTEVSTASSVSLSLSRSDTDCALILFLMRDMTSSFDSQCAGVFADRKDTASEAAVAIAGGRRDEAAILLDRTPM